MVLIDALSELEDADFQPSTQPKPVNKEISWMQTGTLPVLQRQSTLFPCTACIDVVLGPLNDNSWITNSYIRPR
jgi:hypothetical protein